MRISDWSSDVCSSDLPALVDGRDRPAPIGAVDPQLEDAVGGAHDDAVGVSGGAHDAIASMVAPRWAAWSSIVPKSCSVAHARLSRWLGSMSQVKPMPPSTWIAVVAFSIAASAARSLAPAAARAGSELSGSSSTAAAAYMALCAHWVRTYMSASRCLIAWNEPIGTPN